MATRFVVKALFGSTTLPLAISAASAVLAAKKASKNKWAKNALAYIVVERRTGETVHIQPNAR